MKHQRFAVFDIDGTVVRTGLFFSIIHEMIARSMISKSDQLKLERAQKDWQHRKTTFSFDTYTETAIEIFLKDLANLKVSAYNSIIRTVVDRSVHQTYTYPIKLIKQLKGRGYMILAISGSEKSAVARFCKKHGFDDWIGMNYHSDGTYFTGITTDVVNQKEVHLKSLIEKHNLSLKGSVAVGDTGSDINMLKMVERPICFNPNKQLKEHAQRVAWSIVVERKNVIYELQPQGKSFSLKR